MDYTLNNGSIVAPQIHNPGMEYTNQIDEDIEIDDIENMFKNDEDEVLERVERDVSVPIHQKVDRRSKKTPDTSTTSCGADCDCIDEKKETDGASSTCSSGGCGTDDKKTCCSSKSETSSTSGTCGSSKDDSCDCSSNANLPSSGCGGSCDCNTPSTEDSAPPKYHVYESELTSDQDAMYSNVNLAGTVHIQTWGCSHNTSDAEYMAGMLTSAGYALVSDPLKADIWVLNSCAVKGPSEQHFINQVVAGKKARKGLVLAGCVPQADPNRKEFNSEVFENAPPFAGCVSILGVQQLDRIVEIVDSTMNGHSVQAMMSVKVAGSPLLLPKIRKNPYVEIIPVNTGCLSACTYCKTKSARGNLRSYPIEDIVARVKHVLDEGIVAIYLTSEDISCYGMDIGKTLPDLLRAILPILPDGVMLRIGMGNPPYMVPYLDEIIELFTHPNIYEFVHIPVQAGSNHVLRDMKRGYTCEEFRKLCTDFRARLPEITIATDIIAAFPTETKEDWEETMQLCKDFNFPVLFINQFYARPNTPAANYKQLPNHIGKERTRELVAYFNSYTTRDHKVGREEYILVTDISADKQYFVGHNKAYDQVLVEKRDDIMGKKIKVKYTKAEKHCIFADIIESSIAEAPVRPKTVNMNHLSNTYVSPTTTEASEDHKKILEEYQSSINTKGVVARVTKKDEHAGLSSREKKKLKQAEYLKQRELKLAQQKEQEKEKAKKTPQGIDDEIEILPKNTTSTANTTANTTAQTSSVADTNVNTNTTTKTTSTETTATTTSTTTTNTNTTSSDPNIPALLALAAVLTAILVYRIMNNA